MLVKSKKKQVIFYNGNFIRLEKGEEIDLDETFYLAHMLDLEKVNNKPVKKEKVVDKKEPKIKEETSQKIEEKKEPELKEEKSE